MTIHVRLQRTGSGETLVARLASVLFRRRQRSLGVELRHHGCGLRRKATQELSGCRQDARGGKNILGSRAVIGNGTAVDRAGMGGRIVGLVGADRGDGRAV